MKGVLSTVAASALLLAAMLGAPWLLFVGEPAFAQIDIRNDGGYVGRARDILDCRGGLRCSVDAGVAYLTSPASSGSSGVAPVARCDTPGTALGWDGGAYFCADEVKAGSCSAGQFVTAISNSAVPTCSGAPNSFLEATQTAVRSSNLAASDHVPFDSVRVSGGSLITLDTTTTYTTTQNVASLGRVTLTGGHTYRIVFSVSFCDFSGSGGYVNLALWNSTANAIIGQAAHALPASGANNFGGNGTLLAYFTPGSDTRIEVKITAVNALAALGVVSTGANHFPTMLIESLN